MARTRPDAYQIEPGAEGEILRVVSGVVTWVSVASVADDIMAAGSGLTEANIADAATFAPDGAASAFALASPAVDADAIHVYLDGLRMMRGGANDYVVGGDLQTITFNFVPASGQNLIVDYRTSA